MTKDLELVKQLQEEIGRELERVPLKKIATGFMNAFAADLTGQVKGLSICNVILKRVPVVLLKYQRLKKLVLVGTQISDISSLKALTRLRELYLAHNQISDISSFKVLKRLTTLVLDDNQISDISSFKALPRLRVLYLAVNQISDISSLSQFKGLKELYLYENQISDISSLKALKNLKKLDLRRNVISRLPPEMLDLGLEIRWEYQHEEEGIFLPGNPLEEPPVKIIMKGNAAIRDYFLSLAGEK